MLPLILLCPLIGFLINGLWYLFGQCRPNQKKASAISTGAIASAAILASFFISVAVFIQLAGMPESERAVEEVLFSWIKVGDFRVDFSLRIDVLSSLFTLVITGVGALIHLYSIGYMSGDATPGKFFAYLNLFCFAMLLLVMGSSLPILFVGWEGVGLCSYLLIGYWYTDMDKAVAGKKAFIVNRIGDLGFLIGMFLIYTTFGTLDFAELQGAVLRLFPEGVATTVSIGTVTAICLLLFVGCTGKSAQIPLFVWLPDAMAGPTPVSALIHAATMVTSGIYLVSRVSFLFILSPTASAVLAWVGALTALFAATIAITQTDIKKILAYSTVSQLGYMFLACGVGAYGAGVFHVITHAFFKALLFLGAGSVIMGMHHEQDILKMGGLRLKMKKTYLVFGAGWLAICGIPVFSGFFSKDEILWLAFSSTRGSGYLWAIGALTAVMTAFYMTRLFVLTFYGEPRSAGAKKAHESPNTVVYPLIALALLSAVGGFIGIPHLSWIGHWLDPVVPHDIPMSDVAPMMEWVLMAVSVGGAVVGILLGFRLYRDLSMSEKLKIRWGRLHHVLSRKWFIDEIYEFAFVNSIVQFSKLLWKGFDDAVIDGAVVGLGRAVSWTGKTVRVVQTGSIQTYAVMMLVGLIVALGYLTYGLA